MKRLRHSLLVAALFLVSEGANAFFLTSAAFAALAATGAAVDSVGVTTAATHGNAASGNTGTIHYQWSGSTDGTVVGTAIPGATALSLTATGLTTGTLKFLTLQATDDLTTVTYNPLPVIPFTTRYLLIIGDSWCKGSVSSGGVADDTKGPGWMVGPFLEALFTDNTHFTVSNQGIGGTNQWDWGTGASNLTTALAAAAVIHSTHADWDVLMISGHNDAGTFSHVAPDPESPAQYQGYAQNTADYVIGTWGAHRIIFMGPPFIGLYQTHTAAGIQAQAGYYAALQTVAAGDPTHVFAPASSYNFVVGHPSLMGSDKSHLTPVDAVGNGGSSSVAVVWAHGIWETYQ